MRRHLFDASSIVNIILRGRVKPLVNGYTLDLALYEALNAIWKEAGLKGRIDRGTAIEMAILLSDIFGNRLVETLSIKGHEEEVLRTALEEGLTIYDAAYLATARRHGLTLVTDDNRLREAAGKHVETLTTKEYLEKTGGV